MTAQKMAVSTLVAISALTGITATTTLPVANAMMNAPLTQADDQTSRSIVQVEGGVCSGVLIDPSWVLTADHCSHKLEDHPNMYIVEEGRKVFIGPDAPDREVRTIEQVISHPTRDALLIKLDSPANTIPAEVYTSTEEVPVGSTTVSYGWGDLSAVFDQKPGYQTGYIVDPIYAAASGYPEMTDGVNNKLDSNSLMVTGDSGGPLFLTNNQLYGVLSGGNLAEEEPGDSSTTVYTQIPSILDWMIEQTGVDFSDPARNTAIQESLIANPPTFLEPTDSMYARSQAEEDKALEDYIDGLRNGGEGDDSTVELPSVTPTEDVDDKVDDEESTTTTTTTSPDEETDSSTSTTSTTTNDEGETTSTTTPSTDENDVDRDTDEAEDEPSTSSQSTTITPEESTNTPRTPSAIPAVVDKKDESEQPVNQAGVQPDVQVDIQADVQGGHLEGQGHDVQHKKVGPAVDTGGSVMTPWQRIVDFFRG